MALKNSRRYQGEISRNAGIFKVDQVELVAQSSAPSDSDVGANSRIYFDSTDNQFYGRVSSLWFPLGGRVKINSITASTTLTTSQSGQVFSCASVGGSLYIKLPAPTTSGIVYHIIQDSVNAATGDLYISPQSNPGGEYWIAGASGTFIALNTRGESLTLISNGSTAWLAMARYG